MKDPHAASESAQPEPHEAPAARPQGSVEAHAAAAVWCIDTDGDGLHERRLGEQQRGCPEHPGAICVAGSAPCATQTNCPMKPQWTARKASPPPS